MPRRAALLHDLTERLGEVSVLDQVAKPVGKKVRGALKPGPVRDTLSGTWLGHSLHPLLTDVVIGTWTSALVLDVLGGDRDGKATERLIAVGLAAYSPTALSGVMDWADTEPVSDGVRRVGIVHAATNGVGAALQVASLAARKRGDTGRGKLLSLAGNAAIGAGGYLGGHLSYAQGVGVDQNAFDPGPGEWTATISSADLAEGEPTSVEADGTSVLLVRTNGTVRAIHDRCSHRGCSLAAGKLDGDVVECGCHGSRFRLADGGIEQGPATGPQPAYETRERDGRIEIRLALSTASAAG